MSDKQKRWRTRIVAALVLFAAVYVVAESGLLRRGVEALVGSQFAAQHIPQLNPGHVATYALYVEFALFLVPYLVGGYDVLGRAVRGIARGRVLDENFLMSVATIGAFALVFFPDSEPHMAEGAAVILFYQVGELFQSYAVGRSRRSIAEMMDIAPEYANVMADGVLRQVDPGEVGVGDEIVVKPGERIPLDGTIVHGTSQIDTAALTGESMPRQAREGDGVISGCVNLTSTVTVQVDKPFEDSTVSRILELVENAAERKARTENFITRFARYYTPVVVGIAVLLAVLPPLFGGGAWADWVQRGLVFLVVSCPCALVISVPMSFFGGIGGASRIGILVKGSNYLEALARTETVVFDKTGTLTNGTFAVVAIHGANSVSEEELIDVAAHAEAYSNHPIAASVLEAAGRRDNALDHARIGETEEITGHGVRTGVDGRVVLVGNGKLMDAHQVPWEPCEVAGTVLHVAVDGAYAGHIIIADTLKPDAKQAVAALHDAGVRRTVMLTGDHADVARIIVGELGIDEYHAELLPQDKVAYVEQMLAQTHGDDGKRDPDDEATANKEAPHRGAGTLAFVGDGINDAPVLARADVGIAMGALGSDAAIEAADIVLMDDRPASIARAIAVSRKTMRIVWQNIIFALGVKLVVLILAALGIANMWMAVFADVGVAVIAILNAMRAMNVRKL